METKQIWLTVLISLVVALIVAWIVASVVAKPSASPLLGPKVNATYTNATPLLPDLIPSFFGGGGGCGQLPNGTIICSIEDEIDIWNRGNAGAGPSHTQVVLYNNLTNQQRTILIRLR